MKLTCFIVSTLLIVFITQQSTNGLPVDDVTTQLYCKEGFELLNGECQPISSSSQRSDTKFNRSKFEGTTLSYEGTTEKSTKYDESEPCPEGKIRTKSGDCKDIVFEDQPSTTPQSKKLVKTSEEHDNGLLDYTTESVEPERKPKAPKDQPEEPEREPKAPKDQPEEPEREPKAPKDVPEEPERKPKASKDQPEEPELKPKAPKDQPEEPEREPKAPKDVPEESERKPKAPKDEPKEDEKESPRPNVEKFDTPKGCPPGTKVDEQGACQDEVEYTSTTRNMNLKDLLPKDGSCPAGMELFKNKCIYIKSKDNSTVDGLMETEERIVDKDNAGNKLVPVLKGGVCPPDTEYYSNGLCRVRTRTSPVKVISVKEACPLGEILINGKCQQKDTVRTATIKVPLKIKQSLQDKGKIEVSL